MTGNEHNLKTRQTRAIRALLEESSVKASARRAGVGESTLRRWLCEPGFNAALREARGRALESVLTSLQGLGELAAETLRSVMSDPNAHPGSRVKAAIGALSMLLKSKEVLETEDRLRAIEEQLKAMGEKRK